jgi:excisionase family DNA binding protein
MQQVVNNQSRGSAMLTITEVAHMLHAHPNSVRRWADMGLLKAYRFGVRGDRRFKTNEVDDFLQSAVQ